jgi:lysophospholipase L1-like esterase
MRFVPRDRRSSFIATVLASCVVAGVVACGQSGGGGAAVPAPSHEPTGNGLPDLGTSPAPTPTAPPTTTSPPPPVDAGAPDVKPPLPLIAKPSDCFTNITGPIVGPNYDQFNPKMGTHCNGTQQQHITGVQQLVFLGDSITTGTPPTLIQEFYRSIVTEGIKQRFGNNVVVKDCSRWGAQDWDLQGKPNTNQVGQIQQCFGAGAQTMKTLTVMTMGGNDTASWARNQLDADAGMAQAKVSADQMGAALHWLKDPTNFPNGSYVIFGNVYEYTDTSGDLSSCPTATLSGMKGTWEAGAPAVISFQEQYMKYAVETGADMMFLLENFCGHGYKHDDPTLQCYRGPNTPMWLDLTCIHPNPTGHAKIAEYVLSIVDG